MDIANLAHSNGSMYGDGDNASETYVLEAVHEPYQTMVAALFYTTSFLALIFNTSAIVLIFSQFRRRRNKSRITLTYSPSTKATHTLATTVTLPNATANSGSHYHHQTANYKTSSCRKVRSGSSQLRIYLLNLFVNDILIAIFTTPFGFTDFIYGQWIYFPILCPLSNFVSTCAVCVSIYTLIAIGLERYV